MRSPPPGRASIRKPSQRTCRRERLTRFFSKDDHGYRILPELRATIVFAVQDVLTDPPFSRLDLVSCRNLLIYLRPEAQEKVISFFHFALREGGILLLGSAETIGSSKGRFEVISKVGADLSAYRPALGRANLASCSEPPTARGCRHVRRRARRLLGKSRLPRVAGASSSRHMRPRRC